MKCRKSVAALVAAGEQGAFVQALLDLKNLRPSIIPAAQADGATSRYDDYVWLHKAAFNLIHLGPAFGPWHREILRQFELDLREVSGDPDMAVPYWDWPTGRQPADAGWPFRNDLMGGLGTGANNAVVTGPFAGSTGDWPINVTDAFDNHTVLRRVSTTNPNSGNLPDLAAIRDALDAQPYDSSPFNDNQFPSDPEAAASFRKSLEFFLHNGPHNWVGNEDPLFLDMMAFASPNDPIFFLHHAQVDRVWSIWQDRFPNLDHFEPASGANAGHNLGDVIDLLDPTYFNYPVLDTNAANIDLHASGVWYDSDLPEITLATPSVDFGSIPAGLTTWAAVQFTVEGCRAMEFRITGVAGPYSIPAGNAVVPVPATDDPSPRTVNVFVECQAPGDGSAIANGSVSIEGRTLDSEGFFALPAGQQHVFFGATASLEATNVPRPTTAVAFVSDRSGSMSGAAGAGLTKFELLEEALVTATNLLDDDDSAALVFFDDAVSTPLGMSQIGGGGGVTAALADPAIQPDFGSTAIGLGLIEGASQLDGYTPPPGVADPNLAILCLTDGNENSGPSVTSAAVSNAVSAYAADLYAVGLGREDNVSAPTLGAISNYMLITGDVSADQRRFMLTKYFVQIIADVKQSQVIVDPDGTLHAGVRHEIPFDVSEADVELEIVVLAVAAKYLDAAVVTPGGAVLPLGALGPNGSVEVGPRDVIVRLRLPAVPGSAATSHAGRWRLVLGLSKRVESWLSDERALLAAAGQRASLDYSVVVLSRSNLEVELGRSFPHVRPGEPMPITAVLRQYRQPVTSAEVRAHVTAPDGITTEHPLALDATGHFVGSLPTTMRGVHHCRVVATGRTLGGIRFTREATRTFAVGDPDVRPGAGDDGGQRDDRALCELVSCLLRDKGVHGLLAERDVDVDRLVRCVRELCGPESVERARPVLDVDRWRTLATGDLVRAVRTALGDQIDHLAVPEPQPFEVAPIDQKFFEGPMFMPALARDANGDVVLASTGEPVPPRGDRDLLVGDLDGIDARASRALAAAGITTAGELLDRAVDLRPITGMDMSEARRALHAARTGATTAPAKKAPAKKAPAKKATAKKAPAKKATAKKATAKKATRRTR